MIKWEAPPVKIAPLALNLATAKNSQAEYDVAMVVLYIAVVVVVVVLVLAGAVRAYAPGWRDSGRWRTAASPSAWKPGRDEQSKRQSKRQPE